MFLACRRNPCRHRENIKTLHRKDQNGTFMHGAASALSTARLCRRERITIYIVKGCIHLIGKLIVLVLFCHSVFCLIVIYPKTNSLILQRSKNEMTTVLKIDTFLLWLLGYNSTFSVALCLQHSGYMHLSLRRCFRSR